MGEDSRRAVLQSLGQLLDGASYLLSPDGRVVESPLGPRRSFTDVEAARAELARIRPQGLRAASTLSDEHTTTLLVPVGLRGRPALYLGVTVPGRLTDVRRSAVTTAVALLGLVTEQERDRLEARRRLWQKVHELLAHGDVEAAVLVGEAAGAPELPARLQVARALGDDDVVEDALGELEGEHLLASHVGGELWLVGAPPEVARRVAALSARGLQVGVGEVVSIADVAASHDTAARALARTTPAHRVVHWERVVREGAVGLLDPEVAATFSASFLAGLDDHQVETLASFLRHHGSRLKVAEELELHRNTVRNRLSTIESAIGRSLDDPDARASAWLALQARAPSERHMLEGPWMRTKRVVSSTPCVTAARTRSWLGSASTSSESVSRCPTGARPPGTPTAPPRSRPR